MYSGIGHFADLLRKALGKRKSSQWRNVVDLVNLAPLGGKKAPPRGAPGIKAYWELLVKYGQKI